MDIKNQIAACEAPNVFAIKMESSDVNVLKITPQARPGPMFPYHSRPAVHTQGLTRIYQPCLALLEYAPWVTPEDLRAKALTHCFPFRSSFPSLSLTQFCLKNALALPNYELVQGNNAHDRVLEAASAPPTHTHIQDLEKMLFLRARRI